MSLSRRRDKGRHYNNFIPVARINKDNLFLSRCKCGLTKTDWTWEGESKRKVARIKILLLVMVEF